MCLLVGATTAIVALMGLGFVFLRNVGDPAPSPAELRDARRAQSVCDSHPGLWISQRFLAGEITNDPVPYGVHPAAWVNVDPDDFVTACSETLPDAASLPADPDGVGCRVGGTPLPRGSRVTFFASDGTQLEQVTTAERCA